MKMFWSMMTMVALVVFVIIASIGWSVFQWQQCRANKQNSFWFCVGHL